jgi:uncharacterized protein YcaQ
MSPAKATPTDRARLRAHAVNHTFFAPTTLARALERLGFVQADPIRAPARAQDLILHQRVEGYRAGDLERQYPELALDEELLYAYGFVPRSQLPLLRPRKGARLGALERRILARVEGGAALHPAELEAEFGRARVVNAWGGFSRATKRALERLHHAGHLRVARRDNGVRVYHAAPAQAALDEQARTRGLISLVVQVLAPVSERTLHAILSRLRRRVDGVAPSRPLTARLLDEGALAATTLEGVTYLHGPAPVPSPDDAPPERVRFLAPFDPLVWDRARFEQLWGWPYRFEAYTPAAKRVRGYYAMPMLFRDAVIGWVNVSVTAGRLQVSAGFARRPKEPRFKDELEREVERLRTFLS